MKSPALGLSLLVALPLVAAAQTPQASYPVHPENSPPAFAPEAVPGEAYGLLLFTAQTTPKKPRTTHTWAALVRTHSGTVLDVQTISWMPADLKIKPYQLTVEPGRNLALEETIGWIRSSTAMQMTLWGPYAAGPELARRFAEQRQLLESGAIGYQCLDFIGDAPLWQNGKNCIHSLMPLHGGAVGDWLQHYGDASGAYISHALVKRGLVAPAAADQDWLIGALGLSQVPLRRSTSSLTAALRTFVPY